MKKTFYISTAIPYVNAVPHVGHTLEFVQSDAIARWHRLRGEKVFFLTGTDENALKNVQAAEKAGIPVKEFVNKHSKIFEECEKALNISFDDFIRTTEKRHIRGANLFWRQCNPDDIYKKSYKGLYCVGCEQFLESEELKGGKCPEHDKEPEVVEEENYFFRLSKYQEEIKKLIESDTLKIFPQSRKNEVLAFINRGLQDFSISRVAERARGWGIPVPDDKSQIIYVWFDALTNYITALGFEKKSSKYKSFWENCPTRVHVIGKGIIRFHAVYWPAMLLSAKVPLPTTEFVHGYLTVDGKKISKSLGNVINPLDLIGRYGTDALRYFLLKFSPFEDGDFSESVLVETYNSDLADVLGNLVQRTLVMVEKYFNSAIPKPGKFNDKDKALIASVNTAGEVDKLIEDFQLNKALDKVFESIRLCNKYINDEEPWKLADTDKERLATILYLLVESLRVFSILLHPFIPSSAEKISCQIGQKLGKLADAKFKKSTKGTISRQEILFRKFESLKKVPVKAETPAQSNSIPAPNALSLLNLKVGKIVSVNNHPNAEKLYVLSVSLGFEKRQLVAGMKPYYSPQELFGKNIVVLTNLKHAVIRGVESQGMLLAADKNGAVKILEAPKSSPGDQVFFEGITPINAEINIQQFSEAKLTTSNRNAVAQGKCLRTKQESIVVDIEDNATIR